MRNFRNSIKGGLVEKGYFEIKILQKLEYMDNLIEIQIDKIVKL